MKKIRTQKVLIDELTNDYSKFVSSDARNTIYSIRNLMESNSRVEESIDALHKTIEHSNVQNEGLQKKIYYLTIVTVIFALIQVVGVIVQLFFK